MLLNIGLLIVGLFVLIVGGDFLVRGASSIALRANISPLVVGLTIVAFGTSAPELLISINAAVSGSPDLAMGNVVGSNICNLALVLGITVLIGPVKVQADSIRIDWPVTMLSAVLLFWWAHDGNLTKGEGIYFIVFLVAYTVFVIGKSRSENRKRISIEDELEVPDGPSPSLLKDLLFLALGGVGLFYGSEWFVGGARELATFLGVSQRVIGITVLALGTSLPELVTAIVASFKRETDLALGNLMGSNIFNILSILGITSLIKPISVSETILNVDIFWMLGITLIILPMMLIQKKLGRAEGIILLLIYVYYTYTVIS
ncbi:MAG: calcium/sodium antiporter [Cyclobacteriaceae bacterium]|nr:calcium/sodium antiporter [Cyclobacteriaceae bacterium]